MKTEPPAIVSLATANRYLAELIPVVGFREAVTRIQARSTAAIAAELERLKRYVDGDTTQKVPAVLAVFGELMRRLPDRARAAHGVASLNRSLGEARSLADTVRVGLPGDLYYAATLLAVATVVSALWLGFIAPQFAALFEQLGGQLPGFTRFFVTLPWVLFVIIGGLAAVITLLVIGMRRVAAAISTMAPLAPAWLAVVCGRRVVRAHERWRVATMASAWSSTGQEPVEALRAAIEGMNAGTERVRELTADVQLADELGLSRHELDYQAQRTLAEYRAATERRRALASRALQVAIAFVIGGITIAIYLPIFKMGSVI